MFLDHYSVINGMALLVLGIMSCLIHENSRLDHQKKMKFYMTYLFIALAMISEWTGYALNHGPSWTIFLHKLVKCMDYVLTPVSGLLLINQVSEGSKVQRNLQKILMANLIIQVISIFTGWTFYIDSENVYHHGTLYPIYIVIYVIVILGVLTDFYLYGKRYTRQNRVSLFSIISFMILGIILQQAYGIRITYVILTICVVLLFVHYSEFSQLLSDESLEYQKHLLETDPLTGLFSRYAYTNDLRVLEEAKVLPENLVIFSVDINELKKINDSRGHLAGDELIKGASKCIKDTLSRYGKCYRTGGDEFIAILYTDIKNAYHLSQILYKKANDWHGGLVDHLTLSIGYAAYHENPTLPIEALIHVADEKMYEAKAEFYMQSGKNRRRSEDKRNDLIEVKKQEYVDIISALSSDVTGLYMIDRKIREVTAYRISASDHRIRSGVPLEQGFEAAMNQFINHIVHPDDQAAMRRTIQLDFIERELSTKKSFMFHFRSLSKGEIHFHYMKCIRNIDDADFDKIIISFCPEDNLVSKKKINDTLNLGRNSNTILVADASFSGRDVLRRNLAEDYNLIMTGYGNRALEILKEKYRDISAVLYDMDLPGVNGYEFLQAVKDDVFLSSVPIIILTSSEEQEFQRKCIQAGAVEFLMKPYNPVIVKSRVYNVIHMNAMSTSLNEIEIDEMTGLYTKQAFLYHAKTLLERSPKEDFALVISDVQNFKMYNSIHGESKGNELLRVIADYIRKNVINGISARYGSDQFIAIIKSRKEEELSSFVKEMQQAVVQEIGENIVLKFGIYERVDRKLEVTRMCDKAMLALNSIKEKYGHEYALFEGPVSQQQYRAQTYETRFYDAIRNQEFTVWYQPKYNPYTGNVVGAEALVRWITKDGKLIPLSEFLPVFEKDGLITVLDEYVFRTVCEHQKIWKESGKTLIPISVNLSRNSMHQGDIVKRYKEIIDSCEIPAAIVPIEITESAAISSKEIKPLADAFYEAGFSLHMDDFGSESSSLAGLNILHFDVVKLDKSLIDYIGDEHGNLVLMYTIALAKELGLHVVAEGVETEEQLSYLKDSGCESVQGYYYSRPLPEESFENEIQDKIEIETVEYDHRYKITASDSVMRRALNQIIQRMPGGFFVYRSGGDEKILSSNRYLWNMFGCETEEEFMEYVGGSFRGIVCPEDLEAVEEYIQKQLEGNPSDMDYVEYDIIRKDGRRVSVWDYGHLERQPDGNIFYVFISEADNMMNQ